MKDWMQHSDTRENTPKSNEKMQGTPLGSNERELETIFLDETHISRSNGIGSGFPTRESRPPKEIFTLFTSVEIVVLPFFVYNILER